ncbi:MAG: cytochrome bc complex cytochrome b subunit [Candidatus Latescibacteria bacterium]|nr:cytochrome bc complex cytochrome b subunit [Candidatus Latescibacterota bacterium]
MLTKYVRGVNHWLKDRLNHSVSGVNRWLEDRIELSTLITFIQTQLTKPVPKHVNWLFSFGTITLLFFASQFLTGLLLMTYYKSSAESAYDSVKFVMEQVRFGWLIRQSHAYGANFMIAFLYLHAVRVFFYGGYKKPREITWLIGFLLLGVTLGFGFTGYLLPWDQLSYWATTVGTEVAGSAPVIGKYILLTLRGGENVTGMTLTRFFAVHVIVLPWLFVFLVSLHLVLIRYKGISTLDSTKGPEKSVEDLKQEGGKSFFPNHVMKELLVALLVFTGMLIFIVYAPLPLHEKADPFNTPVGVKPEWYFLPMYQVLKYFPKLVGIIGTGLVILGLFLLPFLDRSPERHPARRPVATTLGILFVCVAVILTILGALAETDRTMFGTRYHFDTKGVPHGIAESDSAAAPPTSTPPEKDMKKE